MPVSCARPKTTPAARSSGSRLSHPAISRLESFQSVRRVASVWPKTHRRDVGHVSVSPAHLAGGFLIAAGLYQLTPLKTVCLNHCRGPAAFLAAHWRALSGAFRMGLAHGAYCLGRCAVLMLLLFVGGV